MKLVNIFYSLNICKVEWIIYQPQVARRHTWFTLCIIKVQQVWCWAAVVSTWQKCLYFINKKLFYKRFEKWNQLIFECKPFPIYMQSEGVYWNQVDFIKEVNLAELEYMIYTQTLVAIWSQTLGSTADTFVIFLELSILIDIWSIWIKSDTQTLVAI